MATYQKRGKYWQYSISRSKLGLQRLTKGGFTTKSEAQAEAMEIESKIKKGFSVDPLKQEFADYFMDWASTYKKGDVNDITYENYLQTHKSIEEYFPGVLVSEITQSMYQRALNKYAENHAKLTTKGFNTRIRASIQHLLDEGKIQKDFTKRAVVKGNGNEKSEKDKFVDYKDYQKLVNYFKDKLDPHFASPTILYIISITGMRASEVYGLQWEDIDFDNQVIHFYQTWNYRVKAGGFKKPKTEAGVRDIIINNETCKILQEFHVQQKELFKDESVTPPHDFVCYHPQKGIVSLTSVQDTLNIALKKLDISTPLTIHGLRHTHASVLLYKGIDIMTVSKRLGHASVAITQQTYIHIIKELENRDNNKIKEILNEL